MTIRDCLHSQKHVQRNFTSPEYVLLNLQLKYLDFCTELWFINTAWSEILQNKHLLLQTPV